MQSIVLGCCFTDFVQFWEGSRQFFRGCIGDIYALRKKRETGEVAGPRDSETHNSQRLRETEKKIKKQTF
jgi:hypothetical protein